MNISWRKTLVRLASYVAVGMTVGLYSYHLGKRGTKELKDEIEMLKSENEIAKTEGFINGMKAERDWRKNISIMEQLMKEADELKRAEEA